MKKVLTIAGSDCSGGAGIQADIKTMTAHKVYAMSVITALTAQNTTGVYGVLDAGADFVGQQMDCVFKDIFPDAVKIGMVSNIETIQMIAAKLKEYHAKNIVVINQNNIIDKTTVALVLGIRDTDSYAHPEDEYNLKASTIALEKHIIEKALATFHTKRKAATALGIDHSTLVKKCQRYGI